MEFIKYISKLGSSLFYIAVMMACVTYGAWGIIPIAGMGLILSIINIIVNEVK